MLEVDRVTKRYGDKLAVDGVSFAARPGRILGLLGPNGAGKTSILRMVTNITKPDAGAIQLDGAPVDRKSQAVIGYMPEERGLYRRMKVHDQLVYLARLKGIDRAEARRSATHWLDALEVGDWRNQPARELSRGMQQKIQFAIALVHSPRLVILDEPFSGLDPINSALMEQVIRDRKAAGATIIFASHRMEQVEELCDDICLVAGGKVLISGELAAIKLAQGRNTVALEFAGRDAFLDSLVAAGNVELLKRDAGRAEMRMLNGYSAQAVLDAAQRATESIYRYSANFPSLRDIFLTAVSNANAATEAATPAPPASNSVQGKPMAQTS